MSKKDISNAVIYRLPRYHRYLSDLESQGTERISSGELSKIMGVTASQIRQDLNNFGGFGQQGYGYNVKYLRDQIGNILGMDVEHNMVIIGAGNFGRTLAKYFAQKDSPFKVIGIFDINPDKAGELIGGVEVMTADRLSEFVKNHKVEIGILTVPRTKAREAGEHVVKCGIKAIWNYARVDLDLPEDVAVENVHLFDSLLRLSYNMTNR